MGFFHPRNLCKKEVGQVQYIVGRMSQQEAQIESQEENMGSEYQALNVHSKKGRRENHHHRDKHSHQKNNF